MQRVLMQHSEGWDISPYNMKYKFTVTEGLRSKDFPIRNDFNKKTKKNLWSITREQINMWTN